MVDRKAYLRETFFAMRVTAKMKKLKWLIDDLGLNEFNAWLWITGGAALTAAVLVLLSDGGAEIFRYWRVFFLSMT
jgi:hypothetical protein